MASTNRWARRLPGGPDSEVPPGCVMSGVSDYGAPPGWCYVRSKWLVVQQEVGRWVRVF